MSLIFTSHLLADPKGQSIAKKVYDRPLPKFSHFVSVMKLIPRSGKSSTREFYSYGHRTLDKSKAYTLLRFTGPANIKDTGLLTVKTGKSSRDQRVYLSELKKSRKVTSSKQGGRFVGSDFTYEDLQIRDYDDDSHSFIGEKKVNGMACQQLVSEPKSKSSSQYSKRILCVDPKTDIPIEIEFYKRKKKPIKRLQVIRIEKVSGFWTVMESSMTDLKTGHQTIIAHKTTDFDLEIKPMMFKKGVLENPGSENKYVGKK